MEGFFLPKICKDKIELTNELEQKPAQGQTICDASEENRHFFAIYLTQRDNATEQGKGKEYPQDLPR